MKSRPKVLHATTWEEGMALFERSRRLVMSVLCDLRLPRGGALDDDAGLAFARHVRATDPELPVLLQSSAGVGARRAAAMGAAFLDKGSPTLLADLREFLRTQLGFGEFVFREHEGGAEVGRASDLRELEAMLATVPEASIVYHASRNHFSIWLLARSEFEMAEQLRPRQVADFASVAELRAHLLELLRDVHERARRGIVADFTSEGFEGHRFTRLGQGSMGGKGRSIAFLNRTLAGLRAEDFGGLEVRLPRTLLIATEHFDRFLAEGDLGAFAARADDDDEVARRFLAAPLPSALEEELAAVVERLKGPLAVRSSSLLEDSTQVGMAGLYETVMVPNVDPDPRRRLRELASAIKRVYASLFTRAARRYLTSTGYLLEEEKMAVVIQAVVGRRRGDRFYPSFSGVAQSYNYYPFGPQRPEEGVVHLALGLGRTIVEGGRCLRFSPSRPEVLPQFATPRAMLEASQNGFYALDLRAEGELGADRVRWFDLAVAEEDGALHAAGSVLSAGEQRVRDDLTLRGPRLVTFNNNLRHRAIPLADALRRLLDLFERGLGGPVEIELAGDMGEWGRSEGAGQAGRNPGREPPRLDLLQLRPMAARMRRSAADAPAPPPERCLCRASSRVLGHGLYEGVRDVVVVRREGWEPRHNRAIAAEIGSLNESLRRAGRRYVIVGPGRWGTADPSLGIPVEWAQISEVEVLVEASPAGYDVEPSQGAHFFQNLTSLRLGYLTVPPGADASSGHSDFVDWAWLSSCPGVETRFLRHLTFAEPLAVELDGAQGRGFNGKPAR
jgi:hypothetical protein